MRLTAVLISFAVWAAPAAALSLSDLKQLIEDQTSAPGKTFGDYTVIMDQEIAPQVSILMGCSSGKTDGLGEDIRGSLSSLISAVPSAFPASLFKDKVRDKIQDGALTIDEGEGFCFAIAHETGKLKRAKKLKNGSIYVTTWKDGKKVDQRTDRFWCKRLSRNVACFEVVELSEDHEGGIDGVSGCFQTEVDGKIKSVSMGRGKTINASVANTFKSDASVSNKSCLDRGLGADEF